MCVRSAGVSAYNSYAVLSLVLFHFIAVDIAVTAAAAIVDLECANIPSTCVSFPFTHFI